MILVKNKLRRKKNIFDDEEYLNYLKYSHLPKIEEKDEPLVETEDRATQEPNIVNNYSQTVDKDMVDEETDTYDELNRIIGNYVLNMSSKKYKSKEPSRGELMAQAWTQMIQPREKQSSSSSSSDSEGALSRNIRRGFRLTQFALNTAVTTANITAAMADALAQMTVSNQDEQNENVEVVSVHSSRSSRASGEASPPISVSSATPPQSVSSSSSSTVPMPTSPQSRSSRGSSLASSRSSSKSSKSSLKK